MVIPEPVQKLLSEYDVGHVESPADLPDAVLERVMARGGIEAMRWLIVTVGSERLRDFLAHRGWRMLAPREVAFWSVVCGVPESTAATWRRAARQREKDWRG